eukprot:TRINITY_DN5512_c0_g1_i1.p1 TRINITY_DN5512_c0_g1~~TRINITY_DN5512_c0_g1_i1.p1  ORF type:complete len:100 (+),score=15.04 TRINITY_DN5512_c0_g1_i1:306-605(+)
MGKETKIDIGRFIKGLNVTISAVEVPHTWDSYGVIVDHKGDDQWRIVYSGDTLPSDELAQEGHGATLLIHEATMESNLVHEAHAKGHCTTQQALDIGKR